MDLEKLIGDCARSGKLMQLAVTDARGPWVCTVYFVADDDLNLYWLSLPNRRHSLALAHDNRAAIAVVQKADIPVIGLQGEGRTMVVDDPKIVESIMKKYVNKYNSGQEFHQRFIDGKNQHQLYRFVPSEYKLFDEVNFAGDQAQVWRPAPDVDMI